MNQGEQNIAEATNIISRTLADHFFLLALEPTGQQKLVNVGVDVLMNLAKADLITGVKINDE